MASQVKVVLLGGMLSGSVERGLIGHDDQKAEFKPKLRSNRVGNQGF